MNRIAFVIFLISTLVISSVAFAKKGDPEKGKKIYEKRCWWCHGKEGAGDGPAAEFLNPPPRIFADGVYKFKSTPFDEFLPTDEDFFKMIAGGRTENHITGWKGMNDSSMPSWKGMLSDEDIWDLIAYIKGFAELGEPEKGSIDLSHKIASSKESIEKGRKLFKDRCTECHGEEGLGDGTKKLMDDWGFRTWPRNFTKGWAFRVSNKPEDIFTRISVGIPGTQMPSFADPTSKKKMTEEERWHVANYVASLNKPYKKPGDNTVISAVRVEGDLPQKADDPLWDNTEYRSFYMVPQIIAKERFFTPTINSISVKALYNDKEIAFLLEWDDRTKSVPGDTKAKELAGDELFKDAVAIQLPVKVPEGGVKPYFGMGDAVNPVNILYWQSESTTEPQSVRLINAMGFKKIENRNPEEAGLKASGVYKNGTWRVVMKRPIHTEKKDKDLQFEEGTFTPIAFAAWDGSNGEKGSKHVHTTWYWVLMKPSAGASVYVIPIVVALIIFGGEILLARSARKKRG